MDVLLPCRDGFTAQEAAAAIRAYGVRCTEINWIDDGFIGPAGWQACGLPVRPGHVQVQDLPQMAAGSLSTMRSRVASLLTPEGIAAVLNPASYGLAGGATSNAADGVIGGQEGSGGGGVGNGGKQGAGMGLGLGAAGAALASSWGVISKAAVALAALQLAADKASGKPGDTSARFRWAMRHPRF